ncbi:MAG: T9SS type A sorting domain-containing protein, partial [Bacteroidales bacterium]|nr:T9SS type A sorting domain-containing protein [Bacteroidales bacterium]
VEETIKVSKRGGLKLGDETLAMIGLKFENTSSDFKVLFGEISLTRGTSQEPSKPTIKMSRAMATTYKGIDAKIVFEMPYSGSRQNYETIYNSDVKTWFYKIYTQQYGEDEVLVTATTSWAAYVVGAPYDVQKGGQFRIGVAAVSMDGKSQSDIAWGNWITVPSSTVIEGFSVDKPIIKAGENFTVAFDDPTHLAATWVIKASENDVVKGTFNANKFTTSLNEEGIYDLYLTMNGTTEVYRGKIQISPKDVGALPEIKTFAMQGDEIKGNVGEFTYTGREDADGYVSRGMALGEKAFGIPADQLGFNNTTPFSLTFWIYFNTINHDSDGTHFLNVRSSTDAYPNSQWGFIWSHLSVEGGGDDGGGYTYNLNNLVFHYRLKSQNAGEPIRISKEFVFKPQTWYHVALCMGYTSNRTLDLYINGKHVGSSTAKSALYDWQSANVIMIGGQAQHRAAIDGTIDEVRLYKKVLSAADVKEAMKHTSSVTDQDFIGYWDFESDTQSDNAMMSVGYNKALKAFKYTPNERDYVKEEVSFAPGAPFISGTNYKIETLPTWKFKGGSIQSATGDKASGEASVSYDKEGIFPATLTLTNGWGTDSETIDVVVVEPTGIEDVTVDEMRAFPNPFEEEVYVAFAEAGEYVAEVYDYSGRLINSYAVSAAAGEPCKIAIDGEAGVYFIKVKGEAGLLKVMKVVKK